ncbi:hypothetical protein Y032_0046g1407 [Ancylostoma ceylanicum]|uniref:CCHC-type domain-containing protein n=1 Tax=Ancylostoma ceylanicum TaxID=53326 RepID=A0A016UCU5_9BILA|nr:hypothetical protein Y032_0046g1407 [Ancylostoma ceylanicum]
MSEYGVVKSTLTSAINDLIRATSTIDQSYFQPFSSQATLLDQYRSLCERNVGMTCAKLTVENALNILKHRYEDAQRFVSGQHDGKTVALDLNTYWEETKGARLLDDAIKIISQLHSQLELELSLANQIRDKLSASVASSEPLDSMSSQKSPPLETNVAHSTNTIRANVSFAVNSSTQTACILEHQVVQLRKLEVPSFDGDQSRFYDFWARFKTMVHNNPALSTANKFLHLISSLKGSAALVVERFDITDSQNYELAITALLKRYDRPDFTHNHFLQKLEQLPPSSASASSQRDTLCRIEACVLQLDRFEDTSQSLPLKRLVLKKFPRETQLEVVKMEHRSGTTWSLHQLLEGFSQFIEELEKVDDMFLHPGIENLAITPAITSPSADDDADSRPTTPLASYNPDVCCFCASSDHRSSSCHRSVTPSVRRLAVDRYKLCYKCITLGHSAANCSASNCSYCAGQLSFIV